MKNCTLDIVIPIHNEEGNLRKLVSSLDKVLISFDYNVIFIDDGSTDNSIELLNEICQDQPNILYIQLSRNFGKEAAIYAGLSYCSSDCCVIMDADFQDPPELITTMIQEWEKGFHVVSAARKLRKGDTFLKRLTAWCFYKVINVLSPTKLQYNVSDFRLLDTKVIKSILSMKERCRFTKGMLSWVGFKQTKIYYDRPERYEGTSSWGYWKLWNYALEGIFSFSNFPLKIWTYLGLIVSISSFSYLLFIIINVLFYGIDVPGYASVICVILFFNGILLMNLGIFGEYLSRIYTEVKQRPFYIVENTNIK